MSKYIIWFILLLILTARILIHFKSQPTFSAGTKLRIKGRVASEPLRFSDSQYFRLKGFKIYLPVYPEVNYGDEVVLEGKVQERDKLKDVELIKLEANQGILLGLRNKLLGVYERSLPKQHAALIAGVTIGSKSGLGSEFWEKLKVSGTAHVVVASGMNVTLVAKFLLTILLVFLKRKWAIPLAITGVWGYAMIAGFEAPIVRAAIMGSLTFTAQELGRVNLAWRTLFLSALLMLLVWPAMILDLGFWLSFAATGSLMLFERKVYRYLRLVPNIIREDFSTSLAAQVGVAPILLFAFGQINPLSPIVNVMVLWTIVPMTVIGMIGGLLGLIYEPAGSTVLLLTYPLTSWFIGLVNLFS